MGRSLQLFSYVSVFAIAGALVLFAACNEHAVSPADRTSPVEERIEHDLGGGQQIDLLWMIDNSGSMCRPQGILRDGIDRFVDVLAEVNLDFHLGVTTTHMFEAKHPEDGDFFRDTGSQPGHLQSTPFPATGTEAECHFPVYTQEDVEADPDLDASHIGQSNPTSVEPVLEQIEESIECTEDPGEWQFLVNDFEEEEFRCAPDNNHFETCNSEDNDPNDHWCECPADNPGDWPNCIDCDALYGDASDRRQIDDFFPDPAAYRDIPLVIQSENYDLTTEEGIEELRDDFSCMSFVGTRGDGFEMGLGAVVKALSPEMTGGADVDPEELLENPEDYRDEYPNAGFLRPEADTGIVFVTDENDCTYDPDQFDRGSGCDVNNCTIEEARGEDGALIPPEQLAEELKHNVAFSRGHDPDDDGFDLDEFASTIIPASIHGSYQNPQDIADRVDEPIPQSCPDEEVGWYDDYFMRGNYPWGVPPSCHSNIGIGWSGHRYEYFIREFEQFFPLPDENDPDAPLPGEMCEGFAEFVQQQEEGQEDEDNILTQLAEFFRGETVTCIDEVYPCSGPDSSCPPHVSDGTDGTCTPYPGIADDDQIYYCDSGVEVRLAPADDDHTREDLEETGACIEDSWGEGDLADTCVVDRDWYDWIACPGRAGAMQLQWDESRNWFAAIGEFRSIIRYVTGSEIQEQQQDDQSDDNQQAQNQDNDQDE